MCIRDSSSQVQSQIQAAVESAKNGESSIAVLKQQLDSYQQFYSGLQDYTDGVAQAYAGSKDLAIGSNELKGGSQQLKDGAQQLYDCLLYTSLCRLSCSKRRFITTSSVISRTTPIQIGTPFSSQDFFPMSLTQI